MRKALWISSGCLPLSSGFLGLAMLILIVSGFQRAAGGGLVSDIPKEKVTESDGNSRTVS